jgi:hypothetical protein
LISSFATMSPAPGFIQELPNRQLNRVGLMPRWQHLVETDQLDVPPGWVPLTLNMLMAIDRLQPASKTGRGPITRIYEDDGELRVIYKTRSRAIHNQIIGSMEQAQKTCESCSWPGSQQSIAGMGFRIACPVCAFLANVAFYR